MSSLWPEVIKPGIISPYTILKEQADALSGQTSGVLVGRVAKSFYERSEMYSGPHKRVRILTLEIVVPALASFRWGILRVAHNDMFPYPVFLEGNASFYNFENFLDEDRRLDLMLQKPRIRADTADEFRSLVADVLHSPDVVSTAQALIARVSENSARVEGEEDSDSLDITETSFN